MVEPAIRIQYFSFFRTFWLWIVVVILIKFYQYYGHSSRSIEFISNDNRW